MSNIDAAKKPGVNSGVLEGQAYTNNVNKTYNQLEVKTNRTSFLWRNRN